MNQQKESFCEDHCILTHYMPATLALIAIFGLMYAINPEPKWHNFLAAFLWTFILYLGIRRVALEILWRRKK